MSKITLNSVGSLIDTTTAQTTINRNFTAIQTAMDNTLSRDGTTPNILTATLDANSQTILNLPAPATGSSPARLQDLSTLNGGGTVTNIPVGGTTNQVLAKTSGADFDVHWTSEASEITAGTNIAVTGGSPATISTITTPVFSSVTTPLLVNTGNLTLPTSTDTLIGKATTDVLTNKTFDTAGTGNIFKINGVGITANTGTGSNVLATSPTFVTPVLGVATATTVNGNAITTGTGTLTLGTKTLTASNTLTLAGTDSTTLTFQGTDTYVGRATTDTLTNKTLDTAGTGNVFKINGTTISANTGTGNNVLATTPTISQPNLVGTTTNDNAATGSVGEYVSSIIAGGSAVSLTNNVITNVTSITLSAGDWDITGAVGFIPAATTNTTSYITGIGSVSAALPGTAFPNQETFLSYPSTGNVVSSGNHVFPCSLNFRASLSGSTTYFLVALANFTVSTQTAYGYIQARRRR